VNFQQALPNTKTIAHVMLWFGTSGHVPLRYTFEGLRLPYNSNDFSICMNQCQQMKTMGIRAVNVDYYGPESASALAAMRLLSACDAHGLEYSICLDAGAIPKGWTGAQATGEYIRILNFICDAFMRWPCYLRDDKRALVSFFGEPSGVDWGAVRDGIICPDEMAFIFQGSSGFTHAESNGSFGWVNPVSGQPSNINTDAINAFKNSAQANPDKLAWYPIYPGFDDSIAGWSKQRYMTRGKGKTLRTTVEMVPTDAAFALVATWNDHEEGSELEPGVSV
jgi:hypothetical protein